MIGNYPINSTIHGNALEVLRTLPDESIDCCVTSPPYWGLRDYEITPVKWPDDSIYCLGMEKTPYLFVEHLKITFDQIQRVLKKNGTLWLNLGDSYLNKELVGIPWRVAFSLQDSGWHLRQDIIWAKPNPMPESVKDRCTKAHEYIFLLSKSSNYYFDHESIREASTEKNWRSRLDRVSVKSHPTESVNGRRKRCVPTGWDVEKGSHGTIHRKGRGHSRTHEGLSKLDQVSKFEQQENGRHKRSVWNVATQPFPEAHFATFPEKLIEPCILAGCPEGGIVLDPFMGSGTTGRVAFRLRRNYLGIESNDQYIEIEKKYRKRECCLYEF